MILSTMSEVVIELVLSIILNLQRLLGSFTNSELGEITVYGGNKSSLSTSYGSEPSTSGRTLV
jgi:hypothetical protein